MSEPDCTNCNDTGVVVTPDGDRSELSAFCGCRTGEAKWAGVMRSIASAKRLDQPRDFE